MYQSIPNSTGVRRLSDGAFIPNDPDTLEWGAYEEWLEAGGVLQSPELPMEPPVPAVVSKRQGCLALLAADKLDAVEALVAGAPRAVQVTWQTMQEFERSNPLIIELASSVGLTASAVDLLFIEAARL